MAIRKRDPRETPGAADRSLARLSSVLTFAGWHGLADAPLPVGLAPDDALPCVVVARVTDEHQLGVVVVLDLVGQAPPAVLHSNAADIGTGDSWKPGKETRQSCLKGALGYLRMAF